jgi:acetyl esterase/lipase
MRDGFRQQVAISNGPVDDSLSVENTSIAGRDGHQIPVRLYRHHNSGEQAATCIFLHGGGWVLGDLDTHEGLCNDLAIRAGVNVISVDYRLSPEHIYPAALHDVLDVVAAVSGEAQRFGADANRIAIMGDSAGASLALAAALTSRGQNTMPRAMVLVYPGIGDNMDRPSFAENRDVPGLTPAHMRFFMMSYLGGESLPDPMAAPLTVQDKNGLPPTYIAVGEFDPLRDDGTELAAQLSAVDVPVTLHQADGLGHGFLWVRRQSAAAGDVFTKLAEFVRTSLVVADD